MHGRDLGLPGCPGPDRRDRFLRPPGDLPVLQTNSRTADNMQRTIKPLFHDNLPGHDCFPELVELALVSNGVVVSDRALGSDTKVSIQIEVTLWLDVDIGLVGRSNPEPPIVLG